MSQTPFTQFITLIQKDQAINLLVNSIKKIEQEKKDLQLADSQLLSQSEKLKQTLHDFRREVDEQELEMKQLDEEEKQKKARLEVVANHKEYQSIKSEIDIVRKAQHNLEDQLIKAWHQFETAKKEYESFKLSYEEKHAQTVQLIGEHEAEIAEINVDLLAKEQERNEIEKTVPAEWIEKYTIMRARVTNPVVPVVDGSCSACFYKISTPDMNALERNKLVQCKDCFRLLYIEQRNETT